MKHLLLTTIAAVLSGNVLLAEPFDQKLYDTKARTYSPEESMAMMELQEGYRVELVAAEPMVQEPAAIAFDGDGKLYVAELNTYCLLYTSPSPRDRQKSRMPSSA